MSKLPSISSRVLIKFFISKGFGIDHQSGSHVIMYNRTLKKRAVIPHPKKDLPIGTILAILREAGFHRKDLLDFIK